MSGIFADDVKPGDAVRSILETVLESAGHNVILTASALAQHCDVKQVYFTGSLLNSPLVRMLLTKHAIIPNGMCTMVSI